MAEIMVSNKMSTSYSLKGYSESSFDTEVTVGVYNDSDIEVEVAVRGGSYSDIPVLLNVMFSSNSEILVDVQPIIVSEIEVEIEVNPVNKMSVIYDLVAPRIITYETGAVKDTFVSSNAPYDVINFGTNNSMKVGRDSYGDNVAFVAFDISNVPVNRVLKNVYIRIYYSNYQDANLILSNVSRDWSELSLTNRNNNTNPQPINTNYTVNYAQRYVEFEIIDQFKEWYNGSPNYGLTISSSDSLTLFKAKESGIVPTLYVEYYSDDIYGTNSSKMEVEVIARVESDSTIDVDIEVLSQFSNSEILIDVLAHQVNDIYDSEIQIEVEVPDYESESSIDVQVTATTESESSIEVEIEVSERFDQSEIEVDVIVAVNDESSVDVEVDVVIIIEAYSEIQVLVEVPDVSIKNDSSSIDVDFEIPDNIPKDDNSQILTSVEVIEYGTYAQLDVEISVYDNASSQIEVEIELVSIEQDSDIEVDVLVFRPVRDDDSEIEVEVIVVRRDDSEIQVEVYSRVASFSDLNVDLTVIAGGKKNIYCYKL